ncbi:alpha-hydroxy-acid oxidizing protein [Methanococcoides sp. AM1]|uniref:alpha-hydroxy-acid oxidizing protein n=1 Tax=Methanococcoides sp. AM1 TaxID=1201011 RepID=UPI0010829759|nr:alpha-hydroxy-acid oxidizing protein [Methanococcoides sp. AM1]
MGSWYCSVCNVYHYDDDVGDPDLGIEPGTRPEDFPDNWKCPICGATKDKLKPVIVEATENIVAGRTKTKSVKVVIEKGADNPLLKPELAQDYGKPLGLAGIGSGISYLNNFRALEKVKLKTRLICEHQKPVIEKNFFGTKVCMPLFASPTGGLSYFENIEEEDFMTSVLNGCKLAKTIGFTGDTAKDFDEHPGIIALRSVGGRGVNIFKPRSQDVLLDLISQSEKANAIAVGVDIDGAGSVNFTLAGKPVFRKTIDDLKELKRSTPLPFMVKGIMCEQDALAALETGADIIGISNHGGRVLDSTPGVAEVLPNIVEAIRDSRGGRKVVITADGGIRTGFDVVKMLALGADYVLTGRPIVREAVPHGAEGVRNLIEYMRSDIEKAMIMTACNDLEDINRDILYEY